MAGDGGELVDLFREFLESVEVLEAAARAFLDENRGSAAAKAGSGAGSGEGGRGEKGKGKGKGKSFTSSAAFQGVTNSAADFASPFTSNTTASANLGIAATSGILGSGVTQALLNISGVGQELQGQQNAEAQLRQIVGQNARAGVSFGGDDIAGLFKGLKRLEDRNTAAQEQVSRAIGGEQAQGLAAAFEKAIDKLGTRLEQLLNLSNPNISGGFFDPGS